MFTAVGMVAEKFRTYQSRKNGQRRVMIVVFTDEAGDDVRLVDDTVDVCRKLAMPVYVVGRPAPFGRETAYVKWIDPDPRFDQRPQWVPVTLGPESLLPESLKLRFAGGGEEELLDSGFGPYALTRLCYDTGGLYFATHPNRVVGRNGVGRRDEQPGGALRGVLRPRRDAALPARLCADRRIHAAGAERAGRGGRWSRRRR